MDELLSKVGDQQALIVKGRITQINDVVGYIEEAIDERSKNERK